jgi:quercetin dioxygenase-like cupin family protein
MKKIADRSAVQSAFLAGALALVVVAPAAAEVMARDVTTINGQTVPGEMLPLQDVVTMLDTIDADGNRLVITRGVRKAGTRVAIHVHEHGGHTCVLTGAITDFVEGNAPSLWPAGTCYYMPPNTPMSATNLGTEDAILIDTFILPPDAPTITIIEPGWPEN